MPTLKEAIQRRKDPESYILSRFDDLEKEFRLMMERTVSEARKELSSLAEDQIFRDLEPAKKLAQKTAQEEISAFKQETNERVRNILTKTEENKNEILSKVEKKLDQAHTSFMGEVKKLLSATVKELGTQVAKSESKFSTIERLLEEEFNATIKEAKKVVQGFLLEADRFKGEKGDQGTEGKQGKDGSPDKPEEVVDKINMAKNKVKMEAVDGLNNSLKNLERALRERGGGGRGGGGGMGNIQHESFSTSSATTTVTTSYKIGGSGFAVWAYYNSALIMRGTHYTVGSDKKTLTFTFTLDDSSNVDLIYVRG